MAGSRIRENRDLTSAALAAMIGMTEEQTKARRHMIAPERGYHETVVDHNTELHRIWKKEGIGEYPGPHKRFI